MGAGGYVRILAVLYRGCVAGAHLCVSPGRAGSGLWPNEDEYEFRVFGSGIACRAASLPPRMIWSRLGVQKGVMSDPIQDGIGCQGYDVAYGLCT